jgi:outer membrane protein TolC
LILPKQFMNVSIHPCAAVLLLGLAFPAPGQVSSPSPPQPANPYQGSVTRGEASSQAIDLSLDQAIQRGLTTNLGIILSGTQTAQARGQRMSQLQTLLPSIDATYKDAAAQVDLPAQGLRLPGFPTVIGPFGFNDIRASLDWSLVDLQSLHNYLATRHNFAAAQLSAADARDMVVLSVGNAYLLVLADQSRVASVQAQVATAKVSLDQAVDSHNAGTAPMIDELRARVDYQSLQQQLIASQNAFEKDKRWLSRLRPPRNSAKRPRTPACPQRKSMLIMATSAPRSVTLTAPLTRRVL